MNGDYFARLHAPAGTAPVCGAVPLAVFFDRDGTLVDNVPHNADPAQVRLRPRVKEALDELRQKAIPTAVISNQSVVGRGWASLDDVAATNRRVEELAGAVGPFYICPHLPDGGCDCRKPAPALLLQAAAERGVDIADVLYVGDRASDLAAAAAAGCRGILVPSPDTPAAEIAAATQVAEDLLAAVRHALG